jgi:hypothetical protein
MIKLTTPPIDIESKPIANTKSVTESHMLKATKPVENVIDFLEKSSDYVKDMLNTRKNNKDK